MEANPRRTTAQSFSRLLTCLFLCVSLSSALFSLDVDFFVSSFEIPVGQPVQMEFVVQDIFPSRVEMITSGIPSPFFETSGRKERRGEDTVFLREWVSRESGSYTLGPFLIRTDREEFVLPPIHLVILAPVVSEKTILRWRTIKDKGVVGIPLRITLEGFYSGEDVSLFCPVPENALLISDPSVSTKEDVESSWKNLGTWIWTPLYSGEQALPVVTFTFISSKGKELIVQSQLTTVSVAPASMAQNKSRDVDAVLRAFGKVSSGTVLSENVPDVNILGRLVELRSREYRALFPGSIRKERLALEYEYMLEETLMVPLSAWKAPAVLGSVLLIICAFLFQFVFHRGRIFRFLPAFCIMAAIGLAFFAGSIYNADRGEAAVVCEGSLYQVPDLASSRIDTLPVGSAVRVVAVAGDWAFVKTYRGISGWLFIDELEYYTITE